MQTLSACTDKRKTALFQLQSNSAYLEHTFTEAVLQTACHAEAWTAQPEILVMSDHAGCCEATVISLGKDCFPSQQQCP